MSFVSVDLPEPDGPTIPITSPATIDRDTLRNASAASGRYRIVTLRNSIAPRGGGKVTRLSGVRAAHHRLDKGRLGQVTARHRRIILFEPTSENQIRPTSAKLWLSSRTVRPSVTSNDAFGSNKPDLLARRRPGCLASWGPEDGTVGYDRRELRGTLSLLPKRADNSWE